MTNYAAELAGEVPSPMTPLAIAAGEIIGVMARRRLVDTHLFERLIAERPRAAVNIRSVWASWSAVSVTSGLIGPFNRYQLGELIGEGGFGKVHSAIDTKTNERVAIKILHDKHRANKSIRQRFCRGAEALSRLSHPGVVETRAVVEEDGQHTFFVMELIEGKNLETLVQEFPQRKASLLGLVLQAGEALAYVHSKNIIHRDVKPSNIVVSSATGRVKLIDFDLITHEAAVPMTTGQIGDAYYCPPEACESGAKSFAYDVYSLAVTIVFVIHGRNISAANLRDVAMNLPVSAEMTRVLRHALHKDPMRRTNSVVALCEAVRNAIKNMQEPRRDASFSQQLLPIPLTLNPLPQRRTVMATIPEMVSPHRRRTDPSINISTSSPAAAKSSQPVVPADEPRPSTGPLSERPSRQWRTDANLFKADAVNPQPADGGTGWPFSPGMSPVEKASLDPYEAPPAAPVVDVSLDPVNEPRTRSTPPERSGPPAARGRTSGVSVDDPPIRHRRRLVVGAILCSTLAIFQPEETSRAASAAKAVVSAEDEFPTPLTLSLTEDLPSVLPVDLLIVPTRTPIPVPEFAVEVDPPDWRPALVFLRGGATAIGSIVSPFAVCQTEVTQGHWKTIMDVQELAPHQCGDTACQDENPITGMTWLESVEYLNKLTDYHNEHRPPRDVELLQQCYVLSDNKVLWDFKCTGFRLSTDAEWMFASRPGGAGEQRDPSPPTVAPVKSSPANDWSILGMHHNVYEWVWDWSEAFPDVPDVPYASVDSYGPSLGAMRIVRGKISRDTPSGDPAGRTLVAATVSMSTTGLRCAKGALRPTDGSETQETDSSGAPLIFISDDEPPVTFQTRPGPRPPGPPRDRKCPTLDDCCTLDGKVRTSASEELKAWDNRALSNKEFARLQFCKADLLQRSGDYVGANTHYKKGMRSDAEPHIQVLRQARFCARASRDYEFMEILERRIQGRVMAD